MAQPHSVCSQAPLTRVTGTIAITGAITTGIIGTTDTGGKHFQRGERAFSQDLDPALSSPQIGDKSDNRVKEMRGQRVYLAQRS